MGARDLPEAVAQRLAGDVELAREAVQSGAWLLFECENGKVTLNQKPTKLGEIDNYVKPQRRFKGTTEAQLQELRDYVKARYAIMEEAAK